MRAAVDVGTNTVRLLIGRCSDGKVMPERYFRRITRLGGDFGSDRKLSPPARQRTLLALREIAGILRKDGIDSVRAVGTAIVREAVDGSDFVAEVEAQTGISLEVISGEEEARLTSRGVISALNPQPPAALIIDIGGGSTEFVLWRDRPLLSRSYPLGVVRLAENCPQPDAQSTRIVSVLSEVRGDLARRGLLPIATAPECRLVGTAGTITTLGALRLQMKEYDWRRVNNLVLTTGELEQLLQQLEPLPVAVRETLPGMEEGRGDLIVPGLRIVLATLALFGHQTLTVSDFGLLEGILLERQEEDGGR